MPTFKLDESKSYTEMLEYVEHLKRGTVVTNVNGYPVLLSNPSNDGWVLLGYKPNTSTVVYMETCDEFGVRRIVDRKKLIQLWPALWDGTFEMRINCNPVQSEFLQYFIFSMGGSWKDNRQILKYEQAERLTIKVKFEKTLEKLVLSYTSLELNKYDEKGSPFVKWWNMAFFLD
jgi:hypothetical protein